MKFSTDYLAEECQCHQTMFCANVQVGGNQVWTEEDKVQIACLLACGSPSISTKTLH